MKVIGLTGNIASGKSVVSYFLKQLGAKVIDMDKIGKHIQECNYKGIVEKVRKEFGDSYIENGKINRKKLGDAVFSNREQLKRLNELMVPLMTEKLVEILDQYREMDVDVVVIDAAILFEAEWDRFTDEVWVVKVPEDIQLKRLKERENITTEEALMRIDAQMDIAEKIKRANVVIDNSKNLESVRLKVVELWEKLKNST